MKALLLVSLCALPIAPFILGDVGMRMGGTYVGPVRDIDCALDGGLSCTRDSGVAIARLRCIGATATETGCIIPAAQTLAGNKTWTGWQKHTPVAHGSLTACSAGAAGTWQACSTHATPVYCDGTTNQEFFGTNNLATLPSLHVNGVLTAQPVVRLLGLYDLPFSYTVTEVAGQIAAGTGAGSVIIRLTDATNNCDCSVDCDSALTSVACGGNCTFAANVEVLVELVTDTCTTPPTARGGLTPMGYY